MQQSPGSDAVRAEIEASLAEVCGQLNSAHARLVELVRRALETACWEGVGIHSCEQWVAWQTGLSPARAHDVVRLARRRSELPVTHAAFAAGELSVDQVAVIAKLVPASVDAEAAVLARSATVSQLRRSLRHYHFGEAAQAEAADAPDPCFVSGTFGPDGRYRLRALLDADDGAIVDRALTEARDALFEGGDTGVTGPDALLEVAHRSLDHVVSPSRAERFLAVFHVPLDGDAYLHDGGPVPARLRRQLLCDGRGVIVGLHDGRPVALGRTKRVVPTPLRRLIEDRDRGCRVPGCTSRRVQIHHVVHWEDGGPTDPCNLLALCARHHRLLHRGLLTISGDPEARDGLCFRDRRGHPLPGVPPPQPPGPGNPIAVGGTWTHPTGERLHTKWLTFNGGRQPAPPQPALRC